ncbi:MAG: hypothetical protein AB4063_19690 [Crocosphaera sp.]
MSYLLKRISRLPKTNKFLSNQSTDSNQNLATVGLESLANDIANTIASNVKQGMLPEEATDLSFQKFSPRLKPFLTPKLKRHLENQILFNLSILFPLREEIQRDYERINQPLEPSHLKIENNLRVTTSTTYINDFSYSVSNVGLGFMGTGALAGIGTYSTLGGMGLVGGFGGIGLGLGTMTGTGAILGAATYGTFTAIKESDPVALGAIGLGTVGGIGISATVGGMGLGVGGTAFSIGMGTMAFAGGIVGLGIYGISKMFTNNKQARMYRTLDYLETITREYEEEQKWRDLESGYLGVDAELEALKASLGLNN